MASTKKAASAAHNSRPKSTTSLSAPVAATSALAPPPPPATFAFNPARALFAGVSVNHVGSSGRERLRIWDTAKNSITAEWELGAEMLSEGGSDAAVRSVLWLDGAGAAEAADTPASKKKRRHSKGGEAVAGTGADVLVVAQKKMVGFKTTQSKAAFAWSVPSQLGEQVTAAAYLPARHAVALALENSGVAIVSLLDGAVLLTAKYPTNSPAPSCMTLLERPDSLTLLLANMSATALSISFPLSSSSTTAFSSPQNIAIAPLRLALPVGASQLLTAEEGARTASLWSVGEDGQLSLAATIPLPTDAPIHYASPSADAARLALLATSGEMCIFATDLAQHAASVDADSAVSPGKKKKKAKAKGIPSLRPVSVVRVLEGKEGRQAGVAAVAFPEQQEEQGELLYARMGGAGRIVWETARFTDSLGDYISAVTVKKSAMTAPQLNNGDDSIPVTRYQQDGAVAGRATLSAFADDEAASSAKQQLELPVEGDLADLTLGERLAVLEGGLPSGVQDLSEDEDEPMNGAAPGKRKKKTIAPVETPRELPIQTTQSLTRLLSQALHSNDQPLLSLILTSPSNSSPTLVRNTIRKMPASLALPLLKACVDRLGKGSQFDRRGGGRGGGIAPSQGRGVVAWVKGVLVERGSILMTIPSLPVHLSGLSQILSSRLAMNQPLMALSGRLDLALAQIEMRKAMAAAAAQPASAGRRYVEGESSSDEDMDDSDGDVEIERDDGSGEVEDVRMTSSRQSRQLDDVSDVASLPDEEVAKKAKKGKGKVQGNVDGVKGKAAALEDEEDFESEDDDEDSDEEDEDDFLDDDDDEDESDDNRNPLIDDEASESDGDDEDEDMEE